MSNAQIDVEGLSDIQIEKVKNYIAFLRLSGDKEAARQEIQRLWQKWEETATPMTDEDAAQIAEEAIAEVRAQNR